MLHILLLVLKIIGIIIAVILGILVLLVCIVLFTPVCYQGEAACDGTVKGIRAKAKITWLLHLLSFSAVYEEQEFRWKLRVAWKHMNQENSIEERVDTDEKDKRDEKDQRAPKTQEASKARRAEEPPRNETVRLEEKKEAAEKVEKAVEKSEKEPEKAEKQSEIPGKIKKSVQRSEEILEDKPSIFEKVADRIRRFYQKIKYTFQRLCGKIKTLSEKKDKIQSFLTDKVHKAAFQKVKKEVLRLFAKLRPKRFSGRVHYGFEDPYRTGQVLAGAALFYPWTGEALAIEPDFEKRVLEGDLYIKGKIRLIHIVLLLLRLIWAKDVRTTYRHIRSFEL